MNRLIHIPEQTVRTENNFTAYLGPFRIDNLVETLGAVVVDLDGFTTGKKFIDAYEDVVTFIGFDPCNDLHGVFSWVEDGSTCYGSYPLVTMRELAEPSEVAEALSVPEDKDED